MNPAHARDGCVPAHQYLAVLPLEKGEERIIDLGIPALSMAPMTERILLDVTTPRPRAMPGGLVGDGSVAPMPPDPRALRLMTQP